MLWLKNKDSFDLKGTELLICDVVFILKMKFSPFHRCEQFNRKKFLFCLFLSYSPYSILRCSFSFHLAINEIIRENLIISLIIFDRIYWSRIKIVCFVLFWQIQLNYFQFVSIISHNNFNQIIRSFFCIWQQWKL